MKVGVKPILINISNLKIMYKSHIIRIVINCKYLIKELHVLHFPVKEKTPYVRVDKEFVIYHLVLNALPVHTERPGFLINRYVLRET